MPPKVLSIVGPTASGKTGLAIALALAYNGEVVSADSMQVYRGMDIGTAKVTAEEARGVPHHMLSVADPKEDFSVARYVELASACVDDILARGKLPILAGGTGLYVDALLSGRTFAAQSTGWRQRLQARAEAEGMAALLAELKQVDPQAAARLHVKDEKRILRALEVWHETGKTITQHNLETRSLPPRYEALTIALSASQRQALWRRIDLRVDRMMAAGLVEEVRRLMDAGVPDTATSMQAIGYKELTAALRTGGSPADAAEEIKLRSRQYAKRQLTWFRRNQAAKWLLWENSPDLEGARQKTAEYMEEFGLL